MTNHRAIPRRRFGLLVILSLLAFSPPLTAQAGSGAVLQADGMRVQTLRQTRQPGMAPGAGPRPAPPGLEIPDDEEIWEDGPQIGEDTPLIWEDGPQLEDDEAQLHATPPRAPAGPRLDGSRPDGPETLWEDGPQIGRHRPIWEDGPQHGPADDDSVLNGDE
jgi:hypothetical protein